MRKTLRQRVSYGAILAGALASISLAMFHLMGTGGPVEAQQDALEPIYVSQYGELVGPDLADHLGISTGATFPGCSAFIETLDGDYCLEGLIESRVESFDVGRRLQGSIPNAIEVQGVGLSGRLGNLTTGVDTTGVTRPEVEKLSLELARVQRLFNSAVGVWYEGGSVGRGVCVSHDDIIQPWCSGSALQYGIWESETDGLCFNVHSPALVQWCSGYIDEMVTVWYEPELGLCFRVGAESEDCLDPQSTDVEPPAGVWLSSEQGLCLRVLTRTAPVSWCSGPFGG